jgi:hypothetical protein
LGVTIVSGNTIDLYGGKRMVEHLTCQFPQEVPIISLTPDMGLSALRCPKDTWEEWMKVAETLMNPMTGGSPWLAFSWLVRAKQPLVAVIDFAEAFLAHERWDAEHAASKRASEVLRWADDDLANTVFIICRDSGAALHPALRNPTSPIARIEMELPTEAERKRIVPKLAKKAGGLTARQLLKVKSGAVDWQKLQADAVSRATDGTLNAVWHTTGFEHIGGLKEIKEAVLEEVIPAFLARNRHSPMGVLLNGAPGTGKSVFVEAMSGHMGEPLYELKSPVSSSYVGENERRMEAALKIIQSTGGIVYMDEGDKMFSALDGPQGDSGVQMRVQMLLHQYMANNTHRGRVLFVMAINRLHALPTSLRRAGRFDIVLPFFPPLDADDRSRVITALQRKHGIDMEDTVRDLIAAGTPGWTGADLEALLMKAVRKDPHMGSKVVQECVTYSRPTFTTEQMEKMVRETAADVRDIRLIPEQLREMLGIGK